ncbi:MAG: ComF family protein, partial [Xanthomonadales bacterium]|nr:ComF family protein [Xanthomonadales bacterium]
AQSGLAAPQRRRNLAGAFRACDRLPAHVALVDDVLTTGTTLAECTRTLLRAGARRVDVWVVARADR